jgi:hypothetical protein
MTRRKKMSDSSASVEEDNNDAEDVSPAISWPHRRWASITEKPVADEEDAADIIINLGGTNNVQFPSPTPSVGLLAADSPAVGFRLSHQSAAASGSIFRLNKDDDDFTSSDSVNNEAYYKLQSLGIIVSKAPNTVDIL